jgi:GMP synthase (glutamine-hydrolysing)
MIRQCSVLGIYAVVAAKGDEDAGAIAVKLNRGALGCEVFTQVRDGEGEAAWLRATGPDPVPEEQADAYLKRQRAIDYDLWVIEIEDRDGRLPFVDRILKG